MRTIVDRQLDVRHVGSQGRSHASECDQLGMRSGRATPHDDGSPWSPNLFSANWHKALTERGQSVRFHDLRHTHATLLLRQGVHPNFVSERLGHSTIGIKLDTDSHVMPDMQDEAAQRLHGVLKAAMGAASKRPR